MKSKLKLLSKKALALLIATLIVATMLPFGVMAAATAAPFENQIVSSGGSLYYDKNGNQITGTAYEDDNHWVTVSKTITDTVGGVRLPENEFQITLDVLTKELTLTDEMPADASVALVLDMSGSMWFCATCGGGSNGSLGNHTSVSKVISNQTRYRNTCSAAGTVLPDVNNSYTADGRIPITNEQTRWYAVRQAASNFIGTFAEGANGASRYVSIVVFGSSGVAIQIDPTRCNASTTNWYTRVTSDAAPGNITGGKYWLDVSNPANLTAVQTYLGKLQGYANSGSSSNWHGYNTNVEAGLAVARNLYIKSGTGIDNTYARILPTTARGVIQNNNVVLFTDGVPNVSRNATNGYTISDTTALNVNSNSAGSSITGGAQGDANDRDIVNAKARALEIINGSESGSYPYHSALLYGIAYEQKPADVNTLKNICHYSSPGRENVWSADTSTINTVFTGIANHITTYADAWVVTDQMGADIVFKPSNTLVEGIHTFDGAAIPHTTELLPPKTLTWNLKAQYPQPEPDSNGWRSYSYSYRVVLDTLGMPGTEFSSGESIDKYTNTEAILRYYISTNGVQSSLSLATFARPQVKGFTDTLSFTKANADYATLNGAVFSVAHATTCVCGISYAQNPVITNTGSGSEYTYVLPSGHSYLLTEVSAPTGYVVPPVPADNLYTIPVSYGALSGFAPVYEGRYVQEDANGNLYFINYPQERTVGIMKRIALVGDSELGTDFAFEFTLYYDENCETPAALSVQFDASDFSSPSLQSGIKSFTLTPSVLPVNLYLKEEIVSVGSKPGTWDSVYNTGTGGDAVLYATISADGKVVYAKALMPTITNTFSQDAAPYTINITKNFEFTPDIDLDDAAELVCNNTHVGHTHTDECFGDCIYEAPDSIPHVHDASCYAEEPEFICSDDKLHVRTDACMQLVIDKTVLECTLDETPDVPGHVHDGINCIIEPIEGWLPVEPSDPDDESDEPAEPAEPEWGIIGYECSIALGEGAVAGHTHDDGCYKSELVVSCGIDAHEAHDENCYKANDDPICGIPEEGESVTPHNCDVDSDNCVKELKCNIVAEHGDDCYLYTFDFIVSNKSGNVIDTFTITKTRAQLRSGAHIDGTVYTSDTVTFTIPVSELANGPFTVEELSTISTSEIWVLASDLENIIVPSLGGANGAVDNSMTMTNAYGGTRVPEITIIKYVQDRANDNFLATSISRSFEFEVTSSDGTVISPVTVDVVNGKGSTTVSLPELVNANDVVLTIKEVAGSDTNILTYSSKVMQTTIENGVVKGPASFTFVNTYYEVQPIFSIVKFADGDNSELDFVFDVTYKGNTVECPVTTVDGIGKADFITLPINYSGTVIISENLDNKLAYWVYDGHTYELEYFEGKLISAKKYCDDTLCLSDGVFDADGQILNVTFTNVYSVYPTFTITKKANVGNGTFQFDYSYNGITLRTAPVNIDETVTITIPVKNFTGEVIVKEVNDNHAGWEYDITPRTLGFTKGVPNAGVEIALEFLNTYTTPGIVVDQKYGSLLVTKSWSYTIDDEPQDASAFKANFQVINAAGKLVSTFTLGGSETSKLLTGLPVGSYTVKEINADGFISNHYNDEAVVTVVADKTTDIQFTNSRSDTTGIDDTPPTTPPEETPPTVLYPPINYNPPLDDADLPPALDQPPGPIDLGPDPDNPNTPDDEEDDDEQETLTNLDDNSPPLTDRLPEEEFELEDLEEDEDDDTVEFDEQIPLAEMPGDDDGDDDTIELGDDQVPLSQMPYTGDDSSSAFTIGGLLMSILTLGGLIKIKRDSDKKQNTDK